MPKSIAWRVFSIVLLTNTVLLLGMLGLSVYLIEALEETAISEGSHSELAYFAHFGDRRELQNLQTAQFFSLYVPNELAATTELPLVFQNLPVPFAGEVKKIDTVYAVIVQRFPEGIFYYAQDLALFEKREQQSFLALIVMACLVFAASVALAWLASRKISLPVEQLLGGIREMKASLTAAGQLVTPNQDRELMEVALAFNHYLSQLQQAVKRENSVIALASHEFRTPLAVIAGAVAVIEKRDNLQPDDKVTLARIQAATQDMTAYIQALLTLVRHQKPASPPPPVAVKSVYDTIVADYQWQSPGFLTRLHWRESAADVYLAADPHILKILLHNLIYNALTHTLGQVELLVDNACLIVRDEGGKAIYSASGEGYSGLGLYIVELACGHLGWRYEVNIQPQRGEISVFFRG